MRIHLRVVEAAGVRGGAGRATWGLSDYSSGRTLYLPPELEPQRDAITRDLKEALQTHRGGGIHSTYTEYVARFEF